MWRTVQWCGGHGAPSQLPARRTSGQPRAARLWRQLTLTLSSRLTQHSYFNIDKLGTKLLRDHPPIPAGASVLV